MKVRLTLSAVAAAAATLLFTQVVLADHPPAFDLKFGSLSGAKEVPLGAAGDPDGYGTASGTIVGSDTFCYGLTVKGVGVPVGAHVHRGTKGVNGPIVVPLTPPDAGDPGTSSGCVSGLSEELLAEIRVRPDRFYWNIHTDEHPGGAVRGQLFNRR